MSLSQKQLTRVSKFEDMIEAQRQRRQAFGGYAFKPDRMVFNKIEKTLRVWAQNCSHKPLLDSADELHRMLYNLTYIVRSSYDVHGIIKGVLTQYDLEKCQLHLIQGMIDNYQKRPGEPNLFFRQGDLLPSVYSYWAMVRD